MKIFFTLVLRHLKCFFKDKSTFFFSLMVPAMTIIIYYIMLRQMELGIVQSQISEVIVDKTNPYLGALYNKANGLVDSWMLSGTIGLSCITVSMNTCYITFKDRGDGVDKDFISSPIKSTVISLSYFAFNFILTFMVCFTILLICFVILCSMGALKLTFILFLLIVAALLVSIFSASLFTLLLTTIMRNGNNFNFVISIFSAGLGFFIGAFMPTSMLGKVGYVCGFIPGTYSLGLLRYLFIGPQETELTQFITAHFSEQEATALMDKIKGNFSFNVKFLDINISPINFWWIIIVGGLAFFGVAMIIKAIRDKKNIQ